MRSNGTEIALSIGLSLGALTHACPGLVRAIAETLTKNSGDRVKENENAPESDLMPSMLSAHKILFAQLDQLPVRCAVGSMVPGPLVMGQFFGRAGALGADQGLDGG